MHDYKKLGLKVGLEIHQQLASGTKLFCRCPVPENTSEGSREFPIEVHRRLRPVQSELGEDDPAALFEYLRSKNFIYKANYESSCLVELDESPPLGLNQKALVTAIQISKLLNCSIVEEIHVMRKTVIDGSAVTGFQRTGLVAMDGYIETPFGQLGIQTVNLEEDSAPAMAKGSVIEYRLDRFGIPLVEIATDSTIDTPGQAREAAGKIGTLLRSLDVVRGIGSIRQDVNVSISSGSRVEIKGFQQLDEMEKLVDNEVSRQLSLLDIRDELKKRGLRSIEATIDATKLFRGTKSNFVRKAVESGSHVHAMLVPKFSGLLKRQCGDRTFGKELAAYPEAYGFGILHSDEDLQKYGLEYNFGLLRKELHAQDDDLIIIMIGNGTEKARAALAERIKYCYIGVPKETRVADGTGSKYMRPLPGSGRMYPESDVPSIQVAEEILSVEVPKTLDEYYAETITEIKNEQLTGQIVKSKYYSWFDKLKKYNPVLAATIFLSHYKDLSRRGFDVDKIRQEDLETLFKNISEGDIPKSSVAGILEALCLGRTIDAAMSDYYKIPEEKLVEVVKSMIKENPGKSDSTIVGLVMQKAKGRADGHHAVELVKKLRRD